MDTAILLAILYSIAGCFVGCITGITPGIHTNTVASIILAVYYRYNFDPFLISAFIIGVAVSHSFLDFIPSVFLGAPNPETAVLILPSHRMLLMGRGFEAVMLSAFGGLAGIVFLIMLLFPLFYILPGIYAFAKPSMHIIISAAMALIIYSSKNRRKTLFIFLLSGLLGIVSLNSGLVSKNFVLLPVFSGLFGISSLVLSLNEISFIPRQNTRVKISPFGNAKAGFVGFIGGVAAGLLPGLGTSQTAMIIKNIIPVSPKSFITVLGSMSAIDIILSIISIYLIGNARSGSAVVIEKITGSLDIKTVFAFTGLALISAGLSSIIAVYAAGKSAGLIGKIDYRKISICVIVFLAIITYIFTGFYGIILLVSSASLGIAARLMNVKMSILMGCLIIPTILYFSGSLYLVYKIIL